MTSEGGERSAFERAVLPHLDAGYNLARWLTRDEGDAGDVVQEAAMRAFKYFGGLKGEDALPWFLGIVRNVAMTLLSRRGKEVGLSEEMDVEDHAPDAAEQASRQGEVEVLKKAVEDLPADFREAIVLRELEGMSYKEIASVTGVSIGTVMSRISRGRRRLQVAMGAASSPRNELNSKDAKTRKIEEAGG